MDDYADMFARLKEETERDPDVLHAISAAAEVRMEAEAITELRQAFAAVDELRPIVFTMA